MKQNKQDYKDYIYIRIPKNEYEAIIQGRKKVTKKDIEDWRFDYELKQSTKTKGAKRAAKTKEYRAVRKMFKALESYYNSLLFEGEHITPYKLAKLAGVSYPTAKKFWNKYNLDTWKENFKYKKQEALNDFKLIELAEILIAV